MDAVIAGVVALNADRPLHDRAVCARADIEHERTGEIPAKEAAGIAAVPRFAALGNL
jgi:hypothetical protein